MIRRLTHVGPIPCCIRYHGHAYGRESSDRANTDTVLYLLFTTLRLSLLPYITEATLPPPSQLVQMFVLYCYGPDLSRIMLQQAEPILFTVAEAVRDYIAAPLHLGRSEWFLKRVFPGHLFPTPNPMILLGGRGSESAISWIDAACILYVPLWASVSAA